MDPTHKPHQAAPASPRAPRPLPVRLVTPTPPISPVPPATPLETPPLPEDGFVGCDAEPDVTVAICEYNVVGDWELPRNLVELSLGGSRRCTISIPGRGLSARHCLLQRRKHVLRLHDLDSSHGTFVRARRLDSSVDLSPGDMFTARPMTFVCLNDEMRRLRPTLFEILGPGAPRSPDWVMVQAATDSGPLLLTGEAGSDLDRLAHAIHAMSLRRTEKPVEVAAVPQDRAAQVALVQQACRTSLILPLEDEGAPLDPHAGSMLFDLSSRVRLIALASSPEIARRALTDARVWRMQHVEVRPLAYRGGEINKLLDHRFAECAFHRRVADLTRANQDALKAHDWPGNFDELREIADAIIAHATFGGLRPAAGSLGMSSHKKLARRFERVGLGFPLFGQDE
ncbi:MAG: FHA domain-containing protein [Deltaproteobacteria bacterium]|nr:MAG: FHA domain-containing protein [Deltaproteobacteria bacterium]